MRLLLESVQQLPIALEVGRCEILFPCWLAKIDVMKKSAKMLRCLFARTLNLRKSSPPISNQKP
jgi:hypothetical protein